MVPIKNAQGTTPHLPMPPFIRSQFERSRVMYDIAPPLVSQTNTYRTHLSYRNDINAAQPKSVGNDQTNSSNQPQECQQDSNLLSYVPINFEGNDQQTRPKQYQQENKPVIGDWRVNSNSNNYQTNRPTMNARPSNGLTPATDVYSFLNRLSDLFPDIHPSSLQRVFDECGRDFLRTIDNVLYARRIRKSLVTHMPKLRTMQRVPPQNNSMINPTQPNEQTSGNQKQESHNPQSVQTTQQTLKSHLTNRAVNNKRCRILAYDSSSSPTHHSILKKRTDINSQKLNQSLPSPINNTQPQLVRKSPPPPNVFLHPIGNNQKNVGAADGLSNKKSNTGYLLSYKRPHTLHYGAPPAISANLISPMTISPDIPTLRTHLPPAPLSYNLNEGSFGDWYAKNDEHIEHPVTMPHQETQEHQRVISMSEDHANMTNQPGIHFPMENLEAIQENDQGSNEWSLLFKNILDPVRSMEQTSDEVMMTATQIETGEGQDEMNEKMYGSPATEQYPLVIDSLQGQSCRNDADVVPKDEEGKGSYSHLEKDTQEKSEGNENNLNGINEERNSKEVYTENISSSATKKRARRSQRLQNDSNTVDLALESNKEIPNNISTNCTEEIEMSEQDYAAANLVIDIEPWVQSVGDQGGHTRTSVQSDDEYAPILGI